MIIYLKRIELRPHIKTEILEKNSVQGTYDLFVFIFRTSKIKMNLTNEKIEMG